MISPQIEQQVLSRLAEQDIRYTKGRRKILDALTGSDGPRSASDLYQDLSGVVPLSSLYRSLSVLNRAGVLSPHHGRGGVTRYELAEWLMGHHHHLVCETCGAIDDIELSESQEAILDQVAEAAANPLSFITTGHSLEITGQCGSCPS